jgi:beta-xylosidase
VFEDRRATGGRSIGFERDFWTLGRQTLLDPVEWTADGWFRMTGGDLAQPIRAPLGRKPGKGAPHGMALSDDFATLDLGRRWNFFRPGPDEAARAGFGRGTGAQGHGHRAGRFRAAVADRGGPRL